MIRRNTISAALMIVRHEWRALRADRTAWLVIGMFAAMIGFAVFNVAATLHRQQQAEQQNISAEEKKFRRFQAEAAEIERQGALKGERPPQFEPDMVKAPSANYGPRDALYVWAWNALKIVPPPGPLMPLAVGQSDLYPSSYKLGLEGRLEWQARGRVVQQTENPLIALASRFDLAFVVLYLYPLLILAISFNLVAGERENRTLALLLSQPISLRTLVVAKTLVRAALIFGCVIGFSIFFLFLSGTDFSQIGNLGRLALWSVAVLAYGSFWFALAVAANALGRSSATTALVLAIAWLMFLFLIPSIINFTATGLYPAPPRIAYINQVRTEENDARNRRRELVAQYLNEHPELAPYRWTVENVGVGYPLVPESMPMLIEGLEIQRRLAPIISHYEGQLQRQQSFINNTCFLSPPILMQGMLYDLAGTGRARYEHFLRQVNAFNKEWRDFFCPMQFRRQMVNAADYERFPRFSYHEESPGQVARRTVAPLTVLLLLPLALGWLGLRAYRRFPLAG
jgi:ABC-2 type transport system permease protein